MSILPLCCCSALANHNKADFVVRLGSSNFCAHCRSGEVFFTRRVRAVGQKKDISSVRGNDKLNPCIKTLEKNRKFIRRVYFIKFRFGF